MEIKKVADLDFCGEACGIALIGWRYEETGGLAVEAVDVSEPWETWAMLTVNLAGVPAFDAWAASGPGRVALDADCPHELVRTLEAAGALRLSGESVGCGMAEYRLATVSGWALSIPAPGGR